MSLAAVSRIYVRCEVMNGGKTNDSVKACFENVHIFLNEFAQIETFYSGWSYYTTS